MKSKFVVGLFSDINKSNVKYCHWKSTDHLDASFEAKTDLDVLVDKDSCRVLEEIFLKHGFVRMKTPELRTYPCVEDYVKYDNELDRWIHFHLHYQLPCGDRWVKSFNLHNERYILDNRVWNEDLGLYTIDQVSEFLFMLIRMHMKWRMPHKKKSVLRECEFLIDRLNDANLTYDNIVSNPLFDFIPDSIVKGYYLNGSSNGYWELVKYNIHLSAFRRTSYFRHILIRAIRFLYRLRIEFNRRCFADYSTGRRSLPTGGRVIVFLGMDGAGKTSMLSEAEKKFAEQMNVTSIFFGTGRSGAGNLRKIIFSLFGHKLSSSHKSKTLKKDRSIGFKKLVWVYLCLRDREYQLKKLNDAVSNGSLVLVDRWPQTIVEGLADAPKLARNISSGWIFSYLKRREERFYQSIKLLSVDSCLYFKISPRTSLTRKPDELTLEQAQEYSLALDRVVKKLAFTNAHVIDADDGFDEVRRKMLNKIWSNISSGL